MQPNISIVIVNWNRKDELLRLLGSLYRQNFRSFEVIVVDNASSDGSVQAIRKNFPKVRILEIEKNIGVCASFNRGAEEAKGGVIFGMDTDCVIKDRNLFKKIEEKFDAIPRLGVLACAIRDFDTDQPYPNDPATIPSGSLESGYDCLGFNGTAYAVRKRAFGEVGGYDEDYFIYANEMELSMKIIDAGYLCRFFPDIAVYHAPAQKTRSKRYDYYATRNTLWWQWQYFPLMDLAKRGFGFGVIFMKIFVYKDVRLNSRSLRGILDAVLGLPAVWRKRKPWSEETMSHFYETVRENKKSKSS